MTTSTSESKTKEIYTEVHDREQFLSFLKQNPGIMVFKFGADWCKPCQTIKDDVELLEAKVPTGNSQVLIAVKSGQCIRFEESTTRPMGRTASGVRGIRLKYSKDDVVGIISVNVSTIFFLTFGLFV